MERDVNHREWLNRSLMRNRQIFFLFFVVLLGGWMAILRPSEPVAAKAAGLTGTGETQSILSPYWGAAIRRWEPQIGEAAETFSLDPDFIAAVVNEESNGNARAVSRVGAVGLMGVMPASPGLEWRPSTEALMNPATNLRWCVAILAEIIRQSGGDLFAALAAYSGGWSQVGSRVPQQYAASVLDHYGRAVVVRNGGSPDIASQWTIAVEMQRGYVPHESLLVLGDQPVSGLFTFGRHVMYDYIDLSNRSHYIVAYAVPVALVIPVGGDGALFGSSDTVEPQLQARLGLASVKVANSNPRVLIACLPSLSRLRGRASTRWFAPSQCPSWHR